VVSDDAPARNERTRILIVPDGLLGQELGETFLDRHSLAVRSAADAAQALALAELWRPHLVVFGSELHAEIGSFYRALAPSARQSAPKLIMVTDRLLEQSGDASDAVYDAHLISPLEQEELLSTVAELLDIPQRKSNRVPIDVLVHTEGFVEAGAPVDSALASAQSMSEDSILLEASCLLRPQARGRLQFFLPGSSERLTLEGVVRVGVDEVRMLYVIDLVDLAPQHRALIRRYVESQREAA